MTNPPNPSELLPCPFCGGKAHLQDDESYGTVFVGCNECEANGPPLLFVNIETDYRAVKLWNSRHSPKGSEISNE